MPPLAGLLINPPLTAFDTLSDSFAKQLASPSQPQSGSGVVFAPDSLSRPNYEELDLGTPDCADIPISVINRALFLAHERTLGKIQYQ